MVWDWAYHVDQSSQGGAWRAAKLMKNSRDKVSHENGKYNAPLCAFSKSLNNCSLFPGILGLNSNCPSNSMCFLQLSAFMEVWQLFLLTLLANILVIQNGIWHQGELTQPALMSLHCRYLCSHSQTSWVPCAHFKISRWPPTASDQFTDCFSNLTVRLIYLTQSKQYSYCCRAKPLINNRGVLGFQMDLN